MVCEQVTHLTCGMPEDSEENEGFGSKILCQLRTQENAVMQNGILSYSGQVVVAKKMKR